MLSACHDDDDDIYKSYNLFFFIGKCHEKKVERENKENLFFCFNVTGTNILSRDYTSCDYMDACLDTFFTFQSKDRVKHKKHE